MFTTAIESPSKLNFILFLCLNKVKRSKSEQLSPFRKFLRGAFRCSCLFSVHNLSNYVFRLSPVLAKICNQYEG